MPRHPHAAHTAQGLSDTVFSDLVREARKRPGRVYALHVGDTYLEPLEAARAQSQRTSDYPRLHNYSPVQGEPPLLDAIGEHLVSRARRSRARASQAVRPLAAATACTSTLRLTWSMSMAGPPFATAVTCETAGWRNRRRPPAAATDDRAKTQ